MKLADQISRKLISWVNSGSDIVVPNFYVGMYECDLLRITKKGYFYEYEIKISRSDFFNDFKKEFITRDTTDFDFKSPTSSYYDLPVITKNKHDETKNGNRANRFFFVVPEGLIKKEEVPDYAGLIYFETKGSYQSFRIVKNAKLNHIKTDIVSFQKLSLKLCFREMNWRSKIAHHLHDIKRIKEYEKTIEELQMRNIQISNELYELKHPEIANDRLFQLSKTLK